MSQLWGAVQHCHRNTKLKLRPAYFCCMTVDIMQPLILGLFLLFVGMVDLKRRTSLARVVNTRPEHAKYLPWIILTYIWDPNGYFAVKVCTFFPFDNNNSALCKIVKRGWYIRIVFLFGAVFVFAALFAIAGLDELLKQ